MHIQYSCSFMASLLTPITPLTPTLENLHPSLWRASQLARTAGDSAGQYLTCGHTTLASRLPGGGWPLGNLIELLPEHAGSAELQLLKPALSALKHRQIALLQTPYQPQTLALAAMGLDSRYLLWLRCSRTQDALWAAEQVLRNGSCGALLFWTDKIRTESLRRLHLAAQSSKTLFCVMRPIQYAQQPSPAILRLQVTRIAQGLRLSILKRRGSPQPEPIFLSHLAPAMFSRLHLSAHEYNTDLTTTTLDGHSSAPTRTGSISSALVR